MSMLSWRTSNSAMPLVRMSSSVNVLISLLSRVAPEGYNGVARLAAPGWISTSIRESSSSRASESRCQTGAWPRLRRRLAPPPGRAAGRAAAGPLAATPEEARAAAEELGGQVVVKAQVLTGGRGKAGGIQLADSPDDAAARAGDILGMDIRGHVVKSVWIEKGSELEREDYLSA